MEGTSTPIDELRGVDLENIDIELERGKENAFRNLEKMGMLEAKWIGEKRFFIISNIDQFRTGAATEVTVKGKQVERTLSEAVKSAASLICDNPKYGNKRLDRTLYYLFQDEKVISKEEFELSGGENIQEYEELPLKDLIYIPESAEEALNPSYLRNKVGSFYLFYPKISSEWLSNQPTRKEGSESNLSGIEAVTTYVIYGLGEGKRENGMLMVKKNPEDIESKYQRLSGAWMQKHVGTYNISGRSWSNPQPLAKKFLSNLSTTKPPLLKPEDFISRDWGKEEVNRDGLYYSKGRKFYLGGYEGCPVEDLGDGKLAVYRYTPAGIKLELVFEDRIKPEMVGAVRAHPLSSKQEGKVYLYVPENAYPRQNADQLGKLTYIGYDDQSRKLIEMDKKEEVEKLILFRNEFAAKIGSKDLLTDFTIEEQIGLRNTFNSIENKDKAWNFIQRFGYSGIKVLSDGFFQGGFDIRILRLMEQPDGAPEAALYAYNILSDDINRLSSNLIGAIPENTPANDRVAYDHFANRITEAFRLRSQDMLIACSINQDEAEEKAYRQTILLMDSVRAINDILSPEDEKSFILKHEEVNQSKDDKTTSRTRIYYSKAKKEDSNSDVPDRDRGRSIKITIRPEGIVGEEGKTKADARMQFVYSSPDRFELNLRIDRDPIYGPSLDVGSRSDEIYEVLQTIGKTHHTQVTFEPIFGNPATFKRMVSIFGRSLGFEEI